MAIKTFLLFTIVQSIVCSIKIYAIPSLPRATPSFPHFHKHTEISLKAFARCTNSSAFHFPIFVQSLPQRSWSAPVSNTHWFGFTVRQSRKFDKNTVYLAHAEDSQPPTALNTACITTKKGDAWEPRWAEDGKREEKSRGKTSYVAWEKKGNRQYCCQEHLL